MITFWASDAADSATVASAWVAGIAAVIALGALIASAFQVKHARQQAKTAEEQVAIARSQAELAKAQAESTKHQVEIARQQTELQEQIYFDARQPFVWADFRLDATQGELLQLVVRNEGPTVAHDVRVVFDPPLRGAGLTEGLDSVNDQLARGFEAIPPGREVRYAFGVGHMIFAEDTEAVLQYTVTITGRGPRGDLPQLSYPLNVDELSDIAAPRLGTLEGITKAINELRKEVMSKR
jgi:hypothetical protein